MTEYPSMRDQQFTPEQLRQFTSNTRIDILGKFKNDANVINGKASLLAKAFLNKNRKKIKSPEYPYPEIVVDYITRTTNMDYQPEKIPQAYHEFAKSALLAIAPILNDYSTLFANSWRNYQEQEVQKRKIKKYFDAQISKLIEPFIDRDTNQWTISFSDRYHCWEWLTFVSQFLSELGLKSIFLTELKEFFFDLRFLMSRDQIELIPRDSRYDDLDEFTPGWSRKGRLDQRDPNKPG